MRKYVILDERSGMMLARLSIGVTEGFQEVTTEWTRKPHESIQRDTMQEIFNILTVILDVTDEKSAKRIDLKSIEV